MDLLAKIDNFMTLFSIMPVIESHYKPPKGFANPHLQTIFPTLFRRVPPLDYLRETIDTPDDDFLDIDWSLSPCSGNPHKKVAILCHGLEGNSRMKYELSQARILNEVGFDVAVLNYRGCSGRPNKQIKDYHSGKTEDLETTVNHILGKDYPEIYLVGTSLGANLLLKYLGEKASNIDARIKKAVAFSAPVDITSTAKEMSKASRFIYTLRFLLALYNKMRIKKRFFPPGQIDDNGFMTAVKNFEDFDNKYTAPLNGFIDAEDYWQQASSKKYLNQITVPTLLISAKDDPLLREASYPFDEANSNPNLFFECTECGGHVGFIEFNGDHLYYHERRMLEFFTAGFSR
jgi:predicted alpha/beta-fold hydrolase